MFSSAVVAVAVAAVAIDDAVAFAAVAGADVRYGFCCCYMSKDRE